MKSDCYWSRKDSYHSSILSLICFSVHPCSGMVLMTVFRLLKPFRKFLLRFCLALSKIQRKTLTSVAISKVFIFSHFEKPVHSNSIGQKVENGKKQRQVRKSKGLKSYRRKVTESPFKSMSSVEVTKFPHSRKTPGDQKSKEEQQRENDGEVNFINQQCLFGDSEHFLEAGIDRVVNTSGHWGAQIENVLKLLNHSRLAGRSKTQKKLQFFLKSQ